MAGKGSTFENAFLQLIFNAVAPAGISPLAINQTTSPATAFYVSLHSADPGPGGTQTTSEISYTGYGRVAVARGTGTTGWNVTNNTVTPGQTIGFGPSTGGTGGTATNWAVGAAASVGGVVYYSGTLVPNIVISSGVTPQISSASTITES